LSIGGSAPARLATSAPEEVPPGISALASAHCGCVGASGMLKLITL
jgi:hypothetical protein